MVSQDQDSRTSTVADGVCGLVGVLGAFGVFGVLGLAMETCPSHAGEIDLWGVDDMAPSGRSTKNAL